jgi:hypothetical protein
MQDQAPTGIHLVYGTNTSSELTVVWHTHAPISTALVHYALVERAFEFEPMDTVECMHSNVQKGFIGRSPFNYTTTRSIFIHRVYLKRLQPARKYCFEITSGLASSHIYSFRTSSLSSSMIQQQQQNNNPAFLISTQSNIDQLNRNRMALLQMLDMEISSSIGALLLLIDHDKKKKDLNEDEWYSSLEVEAHKTTIFNHVAVAPTLSLNSLASHMYPLSRPGNIGSTINIGISHIQQQQLPILELQYPFNSSIYSFDSNGVHFVTFNLPANARTNSSFLFEWLINDLKTANENRNVVPWIVVYLDKAYADVLCELGESVVSGNGSWMNVVNMIEAVMYEYDVDLVFEVSSGRNYERSLPLVRHFEADGDNDKWQEDYERAEMPIHISTPSFFIPSSSFNQNFDEEEEEDQGNEWMGFRWKSGMEVNNRRMKSEYFYGLLEVVNATQLTWSFYVVESETLSLASSTTKGGQQDKENNEDDLIINKTCIDKLVLNKVIFTHDFRKTKSKQKSVFF